MKKVSIIGPTFTGNKGAEAMLSTTIARLREKHSQLHFNVFSYYANRDSFFVNEKYVSIFNSSPMALVGTIFPFSVILSIFKLFGFGKIECFFPASVKALNSSEVLLDLAGISFSDGREKFLPFNILTILPAMLLDIPVAKMSQAMGPFENNFNRIAAKLVLRRCVKIFARGRSTYRYLKNIPGLEEKIELSSDTAFLYRHGDSLVKYKENKVKALINKLVKVKGKGVEIIGVCPSSVIEASSKSGSCQYTGVIEKICIEALSKGYGVVLFPNAARANSSSTRNNDLPLIKKTYNELEKSFNNTDNIFKADFDINSDQIWEIVSLCQATAVSRFHAMIASINAGRPPLVIGWSHKYEEVIRSFNLEKYSMKYPVTAAKAVKLFDMMIDEKADLTLEIKSNLKKVKESSQKQFDYINELLYEKQ